MLSFESRPELREFQQVRGWARHLSHQECKLTSTEMVSFWQDLCPDMRSYMEKVSRPLRRMDFFSALAPTINPLMFQAWACLFGVAFKNMPGAREWVELGGSSNDFEASREALSAAAGTNPHPAQVLARCLAQ